MEEVLLKKESAIDKRRKEVNAQGVREPRQKARILFLEAQVTSLRDEIRLKETLYKRTRSFIDELCVVSPTARAIRDGPQA
ncbi:hypothetical protein BDY24DRAFT_404442 [Mrakia frigida]|uniref:uncharacterized protein n=1 Tax=Mrakia frigida TaxID=29902 RepID=UPI003FCC0E28